MIRMATQPSTFTAERIRQVMSENRVSQRDVALALNVSQAAVSRRLAGSVDFSVSELEAVANRLGVPAQDLLAVSS